MKKGRSTSKRKAIRRMRPFLLIIVLVVSVFIPAYLTYIGAFGIGDEASMALFGVVATALGAVFVVYGLNDSDRTNRCETLFNLNARFIENKYIMRLYRELTRCARDPNYKLTVNDNDPDAVHSADLMGYMTFCEVLNEFVNQGVLDVKQMDDLFGDRFFKFIHNEYVQEYELYSEASSYVNIFQLYEIWIKYRNFENRKNKNRFVALGQNTIPELYLKKKLYFRESIQLFHNKNDVVFTNSNGNQILLNLHRLLPKDYNKVYQLQNKILENIDAGIFQESKEEEILESMLIDYCYGLFDGDKLVAVCICVLNRKTKQAFNECERNLCIKTEYNKNYNEFITFDTIQVDPEYRGYGIQSFFLKEAETLVSETNAKHIIATVSPNNKYSLNTFLKEGYSIYKNKEIDIYNSKRYIVIKSF